MANYDTVKAGIAGILNGLGYLESSKSIDFKNASANEYGSRYILQRLSGENIENTIIDRFEDSQEWQVQIAFDRAEHSDITQYDAVQRAVDAIIKAMDKPSNWTSFVKIMKYKGFEIIDTPNYYVADIRLSVIDQFIHG